MRIALTGASGYVGGSLLQALRQAGHETVALSRRNCPAPWHRYDLASDPLSLPWQDCEVLIHAAHDFTARGETQNRRLNAEPSVALLHAARDFGVRSLIYLSSLSAFDGCHSDYGRAKLAVEKACLDLGGTVIRPGLVWGDQSGGVMGALERIVTRLPVIPCLSGPRGLPQYLVHQDDLAAAVIRCLADSPLSDGRLIEAANPAPLPLREILIRIARRHGLYRIFLPIPWQFAMTGLKTAEFLGLNPLFRSDSLTGLVHGAPALQSDPAHQRERFRSFT